MTEARVADLESALAKAELDAEIAMKAANGLLGALRRYRNAAHQGQLRDLRTSLESAKRAIQLLDQDVANVVDSWQFDEEGYLQSGRYVEELVALAQRDGLRISPQDGRLFCYPAILRVAVADRAVLIDKVRERRIRPSVLVRVLRERQRRPPRFRAADFLNSVHLAYHVAIARQPGRMFPGAAVPLLELHELLTMLPGSAREYSRQEFARDIYLLDQSGETSTRSGERLDFHASTGTKLRRGTLTVITPGGQEKHYYAVSFSPAAGP